ncbi:MAG: hypothetical protein KDD33_00275 [Bdellovibrionales bacterium]|nr:hypothetical protein [Bdellovibrionales bacterium]
MIRVFILTILLSLNGLAADINLESGDSIVVKANTKTTVTCSMTANVFSTCIDAVSQVCQINYPNYSGCFDKTVNECKANTGEEFPSCVLNVNSACRQSYPNYSGCYDKSVDTCK